MFLSYDGIEFKILTVKECVREQVYDKSNVDLLYDHIAIRCTAWLNPAATQIDPADPRSPVGTELELVLRLAQPRKKLKIWMDSNLNLAAPDPAETLLESPPLRTDGKYATTDALFGPECRVHAIIPDHGNASLVVDLEFHTHLSPCKGEGSQPPTPILSNRWTYKIAYNPASYAEVRIIEGVAYFRMDELIAQLNGVADKTREYLVFPKMLGYQRTAPVFELSEGGDALHYVIIDEQQSMSFPIGNRHKAAFIKVVEKRQYVQEHGSREEFVESVKKLFTAEMTGNVSTNDGWWDLTKAGGKYLRESIADAIEKGIANSQIGLGR